MTNTKNTTTILFKGFVPTKNKKCLMPFKDKTSADLLTYEQVRELEEFAGILDEDTVLIDVDDHEQSEILMDIVEDLQLNCQVRETTRGKHFLFKNSGSIKACKTGTKLACGLTADIKVGLKNSYSVIKYGGKERPIIFDKDENSDYDTVPAWLIPVKTNQDFLEMGEGDGRNQALYSYILTLQSHGLNEEEAKKCIEIINKYILKDALDTQEVEVITRKESFKKTLFFKDKTFLFDKFAEFMIKEHNIKRINSRLHIYEDGIYIMGDHFVEAAMIKHIPGLNKQKRNEVMAYINLLTTQDTEQSHPKYIAFKNGIYNIEDDTLVPFTPNIVITNKINYCYNPGATSSVMENSLCNLACDDEDIIKLIEEMVGYCFYRDNFLRKAFILTGSKRNGKSTFLETITELLGEHNTVALDLKELGDRFKTAEMFNKLANIGDDIEDDFIANVAIFKKVVAGNRVNAERKGQDPFNYQSYAKQIFSANDVPRMKDKSGAVLDRLIIIPFNAKFNETDEDFNPYIKYELRKPESLEYLILRGIQGLKRLIETRKFTTSNKVTERLAEYEENNNPIIGFFKEMAEEGYEFDGQPTKHVYQRYNEFCLSNNYQALSNIEFSKQVKKRYGFKIVNKTISGKKYRIFTSE